MTGATTWVVIIKFKAEREIERRPLSPPFGRRNYTNSGIRITDTATVMLDQPLIILPDGEAHSIEVIPITNPTLIHGKDIKRVLR